jgi:hypothetical protein
LRLAAFEPQGCGTAHEPISRPKTHRYPERAMNDADQQHLEEIRTKIRRIAGHKELSGKQIESLRSLVQQAEKLTGSPFFSEDTPCGAKPNSSGWTK